MRLISCVVLLFILVLIVDAKKTHKHGRRMKSKSKHGHKRALNEYENSYEPPICCYPCSEGSPMPTMQPSAPTPPTKKPSPSPTVRPSNEPSRPPRTHAPISPLGPVSAKTCSLICRHQPNVKRGGRTVQDFARCGMFINRPNCYCKLATILKGPHKGDSICNGVYGPIDPTDPPV